MVVLRQRGRGTVAATDPFAALMAFSAPFHPSNLPPFHRPVPKAKDDDQTEDESKFLGSLSGQ